MSLQRPKHAALYSFSLVSPSEGFLVGMFTIIHCVGIRRALYRDDRIESNRGVLSEHSPLCQSFEMLALPGEVLHLPTQLDHPITILLINGNQSGRILLAFPRFVERPSNLQQVRPPWRQRSCISR